MCIQELQKRKQTTLKTAPRDSVQEADHQAATKDVTQFCAYL